MYYGKSIIIDILIVLSYTMIMDLPLNKAEFDYIVTTLWKCRGSEKQCTDLYQKLNLVKEVMDENPNGSYKKILREKYGMTI